MVTMANDQGTKLTICEEELELLSDVIAAAIRQNYNATKITTSKRAIQDIATHNSCLSHLNSKICALMEEDKE